MQTERADALQAMRRELDGLGSGGRTWLVRGSPGIGKTHFADRFIHQLPANAVAFASKAPQTGSPPLMPLCRALGSQAGDDATRDIEAVLTEFSQSVPILKETLGPLVRARQKLRFGPLPADVAPKEAHTFFVLSEMLRRLGSHKPTVFCLDDIQWLDASSTAFLGFLAEELPKLPVFVLLLARANGSDAPAVASVRCAMAKRGERFTVYDVPPLTLQETVRVAERTLEGAPRSRVSAAACAVLTLIAFFACSMVNDSYL